MSRALNKLSDTQLRKINGTPAPKTTFLNDGGNLSVRHSTSGLLTWYFTYRAGAGRQVSPERLKLGNYPDLSLKAARKKRHSVAHGWQKEKIHAMSLITPYRKH